MLRLFILFPFILILFFGQVNVCRSQGMPPLPPNQLVLPGVDHTIEFSWKADSLNGRWDPYAALLIPVKLPGCDRQFYMQFDLGAPNSMFYRNKMKDISKKYPNAVKLSDSVNKLQKFSFSAGNMNVFAKEIDLPQFDSTPIRWNKNGMEIIGTLGADLIENKVVSINYPGKFMVIGDNVPGDPRLQWANLIFARRSLLFPAIIKGKKTMLFFDTGSSAFELLTDKETALSLSANPGIPLSYPVRSWNKMLKATTIASNDSVEIALKKIPLVAVTYVEGASENQVNQMKALGIGGMTGNKLFLGYTLVIDTKNNKFGLMKQ